MRHGDPVNSRCRHTQISRISCFGAAQKSEAERDQAAGGRAFAIVNIALMIALSLPPSSAQSPA
jgi:hypothetical protein